MENEKYDRQQKYIPLNFSLELLKEKFLNALEISGKTQRI